MQYNNLFQVSTNGVISFSSPFTSSRAIEFSRCTPRGISHPVVAPLWADFDTTREGSLFYRSTSDSVALGQIMEKINNYSTEYSSYAPRSALVVTWDQVPLHEQPNSKVQVHSLAHSSASTASKCLQQKNGARTIN